MFAEFKTYNKGQAKRSDEDPIPILNFLKRFNDLRFLDCVTSFLNCVI